MFILENNISFLDALDQRILIGDGAMGTMLQSMGIAESPDHLNIDEQKIEKVIEVHLGYLNAGSDIIQTNTFGANPVKLKSYQLEQKIEEINKNAVLAVREAISRYRSKTGSSRKIFIAADIGPLGQLLEPSGTISADQAIHYFRQQIEILAGMGSDVVLIETMMDINEALAALKAAQQAAEKLPAICSLTFGPNGVTMMGNKAQDAVKQLQEAGAAVVGANCSLGSVSMLEVAQKMREADKKAKLLFQPNAGLPVLKDGQTVYNESAQIMAANIAKYLPYNPSIIGACCGSTPQHIQEIIKVVS